jgi:hypothetical protein
MKWRARILAWLTGESLVRKKDTHENALEFW